jgi:hypothetical protein
LGSATPESLVLANAGAAPITYLGFVDSYYAGDTVSVTFTTNRSAARQGANRL